MQSFTKAGILLLMFLLVGFTVITETEKENRAKGNPQQNEAVSNDSKTESIFDESNPIIEFVDRGKMTASWYGPNFHGRLTANGEIYNQMAFTAAHKEMKFGTLLKITNPKNGKSVIVRINDRGPYIKGRELDLSKGAAIALGIIKKGVSSLKVEEVALTDENRALLALE